MAEETRDTGGGANVEGNADTGGGAFTGRDHISQNVNVYPTPPARRRKSRARDVMAESVMERVTWKLNEHDVKLAKLELYRDADRQTVLEYKQDLQKDVEELRAELKPLKNQGLLAQPHPEADKEETERIKRQNNLTIRLLTIIAISFGGGLLVFVVFLVWLALGRT